MNKQKEALQSLRIWADTKIDYRFKHIQKR